MTNTSSSNTGASAAGEREALAEALVEALVKGTRLDLSYADAEDAVAMAFESVPLVVAEDRPVPSVKAAYDRLSLAIHGEAKLPPYYAEFLALGTAISDRQDWFAGDVDADGNELVLVRKDSLSGQSADGAAMREREALEKIAALLDVRGSPYDRMMAMAEVAAQALLTPSERSSIGEVREALEIAKEALANYAAAEGYTDNNGEPYSDSDEAHPGKLAEATLAKIAALETSTDAVAKGVDHG